MKVFNAGYPVFCSTGGEANSLATTLSTALGAHSVRRECYEIVLFLLSQAYAEAGIVELDHRLKIFCRAVVKIGCARGETAQNRAFDLPMSFQLPVINARPADAPESEREVRCCTATFFR